MVEGVVVPLRVRNLALRIALEPVEQVDRAERRKLPAVLLMRHHAAVLPKRPKVHVSLQTVLHCSDIVGDCTVETISVAGNARN